MIGPGCLRQWGLLRLLPCLHALPGSINRRLNGISQHSLLLLLLQLLLLLAQRGLLLLSEVMFSALLWRPLNAARVWLLSGGRGLRRDRLGLNGWRHYLSCRTRGSSSCGSRLCFQGPIETMGIVSLQFLNDALVYCCGC